MSEQAAEGTPAAPEAVEIPLHGDAAFGALMDALAPVEDPAPAGAAEAAPVGADTGGQPAAAGTPAGGAPGAAPVAGEPAAGGAAPAAPAADGAPAGGAEQPAAGPVGGDLPAGWTASSAELIPKFGELSTALEDRTAKAYQDAALEEVRTEHANYFEALQKHPRLLVGTQVPAIGREGMETLRDTDDAREWQEAVKSILVAEVRDRAGRALEENSDFLTTVHASIELFQNNADLVPGTKDFDVELANRFVQLAEPYELRVEGKLQGYSIPVQPIVNQLRSQIAAERAKAVSQATPAAGPAAGAAAPAAAPAAPPEPPQAGIPSKAGAGAASEDFSALFGTIGLPNLQI